MSPLENQTDTCTRKEKTVCHVNAGDFDQYWRLPVKDSHAVLHRPAGKNMSAVVWYRFGFCNFIMMAEL